ncbi:MAG TPA: YlbF family regulator [Clostridia bacterium]|nr:YlbF family regulator [Clostridia bacterium]
MSVYDKAYELAQALINSPEYLHYMACKEKLEKDLASYSMLQHFRRQQWEVQMFRLLGHEVNEEVTQELEQLYAYLSAEPVINEYLTAEYQFSRMVSTVQKILSEAIGFWTVDEPCDKNIN